MYSQLVTVVSKADSDWACRGHHSHERRSILVPGARRQVQGQAVHWEASNHNDTSLRGDTRKDGKKGDK